MKRSGNVDLTLFPSNTCERDLVSQFDKGQLVIVKEDCDETWYCGHIIDVHPDITVRLPAGGSAFTWDQVCHCDDMPEETLAHVRGWNWVKREENEDLVMPPGLEDEDRYIYPMIRENANWGFLESIFLLCTVIPPALNIAWLALAKPVPDGDVGKVDFLWYAGVYDGLYMLAKGCTVASLYCAFLPEPVEGHALWLYALQALLWPLINLALHGIWLTAGLINTDITWALLKLNLPLTGLLASLITLPLVLRVEYHDCGCEGARREALKRYGLLGMTCGVSGIFLAMAHGYLHLFREYQAGALLGTPESEAWKGVMELVWILGFTQGYVVLLGKALNACLLLTDRFCPTTDVQRQRLAHLITVQVDMHHVMFQREFLLLSQGWLVCFLVLKDFAYDVFHFGVKSCPTYLSALLMGFRPKSVFQCGFITTRYFKHRSMEWLSFCLMLFADILELPKRLACAATWELDTAYPGQSGSTQLFFAETCVTIKRMPANLDEEFERWVQSSNQVRVWDRHTKGLSFDQAHVRRITEGDVPPWGNILDGFKDPAKARFYRDLATQVGAIIFQRYRARLGAKLVCALVIATREHAIRLSASGEVLNNVTDTTQPLSAHAHLCSYAFLLADVASFLIVGWFQFSQIQGTKAEQYRLIRFARIFASSVFRFAVVLVHLSLNSDVFGTLSTLRFGR